LIRKHLEGELGRIDHDRSAHSHGANGKSPSEVDSAPGQ
jgi:hypothetical protein